MFRHNGTEHILTAGGGPCTVFYCAAYRFKSSILVNNVKLHFTQ